MSVSRRLCKHPFVHLFTSFSLMLALAGSTVAFPGAVAAQRGDDPLDLAAMALTPWDLDDAGLENYGHGYSEMVFLDAFAAGIAMNRDMSAADVADELDDAGFIRAYFAYFYSPADDTDTEQVVFSYIIEFADADGAGDAFEFLEDESDNPDVEDLAGFDEFGDASEATLSSGEDPDTGDPYVQIDTTVLIGQLHAGVGVVDWTGEEPDEDVIIELVDYALERVEDGFDANQPALSNQVVRLSGDSVSGYHDTYTLRDGDAIWFSDETPDVADEQLDISEDEGWIEEYRVWQYLGSLSDDPDASLWSYITLLRFDDEDDAEAWIDDQEGVVESDETFTDMEIDAADYGDAAFTYTAVTLDGAYVYRGITFQLGEIVATIDLSAPVEPTEAAIEAIADEQLACLEDGECLDPIELPRAIERFIADAESGATPDDDETPEADETPDDGGEEQPDGGPVLYESELYGFAIAFNVNEWQFTPEEDPADDEYEWLRFDNEVSTVWMVADPDFGADDLTDCVEHYLVELGWEDAWEVETLEELAEANGRARVSYTTIDPLFGMTGYLSVECRSIDDDTSLMITHFAGTDEEGDVPEAEIELVQDLLDGIEIYGNSGDGDAGESAASGSNDERYTSEEWGYTVSWDPEFWGDAGGNLDDGIRLAYRLNTLASVTIFAVEGDEADPESCFEASIEDDGEGSELVAADDLPAPELADGAVGGVFMLGDFATMYFECRPLVEGDAALRIAFGTPAGIWEDVLPHLEAILTGIEIPESDDQARTRTNVTLTTPSD